ncbi:MAG: hypothetical protein CMF59_09195 [Leptospiraceae bacterium]|nr:hypothetical protein [Leptospiraceae bacterium]
MAMVRRPMGNRDIERARPRSIGVERVSRELIGRLKGEKVLFRQAALRNPIPGISQGRMVRENPPRRPGFSYS